MTTEHDHKTVRAQVQSPRQDPAKFIAFLW
jgi:hypothetical protein